MKRLFATILLLLGIATSVVAQSSQNARADNIVGVYTATQGGERFKAAVSRQVDGTYKAQIVWVEHDRDASGKKLLDSKNPDKHLRNTPCDRIVLVSGLHYNAKRQQWDNAKIYDPLRGLKANVVMLFEPDGRLKVKGSLMGISETLYWIRVEP